MSKVLILGYGNCLRGDDGIGWLAAEKLQVSLIHPDLQVCTAHQLYPEMVAQLHDIDYVIFIDASVEGIPGQISCSHLSDQPVSGSTLGHTFAPQQLLACAAALYGRAPAAHLYTVTGVSFAYEMQLSSLMQLILPVLVRDIEGLCAALLMEASPM